MSSADKNWRHWIGTPEVKSVVVPALTHERLRRAAEETHSTIQFWTNAAIKWFFAHHSSEQLIESMRGFTLDQYEQRVAAQDRLIEHLLDATQTIVTYKGEVRGLDRPLQIAGYTHKELPAPKTAEPKSLPAPPPARKGATTTIEVPQRGGKPPRSVAVERRNGKMANAAH